VATLALILSGLSVHHRPGRTRFLFWLITWVLLAWTLIAVAVFITSSRGSSPELWSFLAALLLVFVITLALLLPLLLLAFFQAFYRARLTAWLSLPPAEPVDPPRA